MNFAANTIKCLAQLFSHLPLKLVHKIGSGIGYLASFIPGRMIRVAKINIERCFPELSKREQTKLLRENFREIGRSVSEVPAFWIKSKEKLLPLIKEIIGEEAFIESLKANKGAILLGSHMGAEELLNVYLSTRYQGTWIYRPQRGYLEAFIHSARQRFGAKFVPTTTQGVRELFKALANGQVIGMSCDHNAPSESGVYAPFFGINTWSMTLAAKFAQKTKAPVFLVFMERLANAKGFRLHFVKANDGIYDDDIRIAVASMNKDLEQFIRRYPSQYQWQYKRFRTQPEGTAPFYW